MLAPDAIEDEEEGGPMDLESSGRGGAVELVELHHLPIPPHDLINDLPAPHSDLLLLEPEHVLTPTKSSLQAVHPHTDYHDLPAAHK